jgi:membrane protease subunit HflC
MNDPKMAVREPLLRVMRESIRAKLAAVLALFVLALAVFSLTVVETGQVAVVNNVLSEQSRIVTEPGVTIRWPFIERAWLIDTRLQVAEQSSLQTYVLADKQTVQLAGWMAWRVSDPVRFNTATDNGRSPVEPKLFKALGEALTPWLATQTNASLMRAQDDGALRSTWLSALNAQLEPLGVTVERAGLRQSAPSEAAMTAIYARMSAQRTQNTRQMIDGLVADERQLLGVQQRQQTQVLDTAYRAAQQTRQTADSQLLAAYARQFGGANGFAEALHHPSPAVATSPPVPSPEKPAP